MKGKYTFIHIDYTQPAGDAPADDDEEGSDSKEEKKKSSKLDDRVQSLVELIYDKKMMEKQMMEMDFDVKKMPLGRLAQSQIDKGYKVLQKMAQYVEDGKASGSKYQELTDEFYTLIPHVYFNTLPTINTHALIKKKLELLEALKEVDAAIKILNAKVAGEESPIDTHYNKLNCNMTTLKKDSKDFKLIQEYVKNTHGSTHRNYTLDIEDVFEIDRKGEDERFAKFADNDNRMLLWYGSRLTNFVGILSQGLRIAPPEAPVTGYMFGKGVYFADMVSKSANYCATTRQNPTVSRCI